MDNDLPDQVAVFLGDLGTDLPNREQKYWLSFNISTPGTMSDTAIRRSFLGQFCDSEQVENRLVISYERLNEAWESQYGWPLYKQLHEGDAHIPHSIHVPTNPSFGQFDDQIVKLAKLAVDSLNEEGIVGATTNKTKSTGGISKLETLLDQLGISSTELCSILRQIQGARTHSAAHRKGGEFDLQLLLNGAADLPALFAELLESIIEHFDAAAQLANSSQE